MWVLWICLALRWLGGGHDRVNKFTYPGFFDGKMPTFLEQGAACRLWHGGECIHAEVRRRPRVALWVREVDRHGWWGVLVAKK